MRLSGSEYVRVSQVNGVRSVQNKSAVAGVASTAAPTSAAQVSFSTQAKEVHRVAQLAAQSPDIRTDRVEELRNQIANGTYNVSGEQIAEMMLRRLQADQIR